MKRLACLIAILVTLQLGAEARGASPAARTSTPKITTKASGSKKAATKKPPPAKKPKAAVPRNSKGRIKRSEAAKHTFEMQTGYPHGRKGYVVDHIVPLACGGADTPSNMQWETVAEAKAKDRVERKGC